MTHTFFWHDYETFGAVPRRDRPSQFAGIRTDEHLNEIGDAVMIYCQPAIDYVPEPIASLITGITPQQCQTQGISEYQFANIIHKELSKNNTIGVGYNTIRFDDEVTRFLFWRNLIDPYAREWQNQCGRWDILDMVRTAYALRPHGIDWPTNSDGKPSFRLEHLTQANGIAHEAAHDALSDVRATIAIAKLIKNQHPKLFEFCLKLHKKDAVLAEIGYQRPILHISGMYPAEKGCLAIVWPIATHPTNKNEIIVWDLAQDPRQLSELNAQQIRERLFSKTDALPLGEQRLPIKTIHINKSPIVISSLDTLNEQMAQKWGIDKQQALYHASFANEVTTLTAGLWEDVFYHEWENEEKQDVDQALYSGFVSRNDRNRLEQLRSRDGKFWASLPDTWQNGFEDPRLEPLLLNYRARNFPNSLNQEEQKQWVKICQDKVLLGVGGGLTLEAFEQVLTEQSLLPENQTPQKQQICKDLHAWGQHLKSTFIP